MKTSKRIIVVSFLIQLVLFWSTMPESAFAAAEDLLPGGLVIAPAFEPGSGPPVGTVHTVAGEAVLIHKGGKEGYRALADLPVFLGDTVITRPKGRLRLNLNDGSSLTMTPVTKIVINESVYNPGTQEQKTVLGLDMGKVRFVVNKLLDFKQSKFEVETPTAILGVRGSDFVGDVAPGTTVATTFENTRLEVRSRKVKGAPVLLQDFERSRVKMGKSPTPAEKVSFVEIQRLKKEFDFTPDTGAGQAVRSSVAASPLTSAQNCSLTKAPGFIPGTSAADRLIDWAQKGGR